MSGLKFIAGAITGAHIIETDPNLPTDQNGASTSFTGRVRGDKIQNKKVVAIDFTAHEEIALQRSKEITNKVMSEFNINEVRILHSLGEIKVGEACFYVEIKSAHRKEAFECLPRVVNEIKKQCPIFGKEILEDGSYVWKKNKN